MATVMATQEECLIVITDVVQRFNDHDAGNKRDRLPTRTVGITILDLDVTYKADLVAGYIVDVRLSQSHNADIRLLCSSDDLLGMVNGEVSFPHAWSTGRVRIDASLRDLIKLRALA